MTCSVHSDYDGEVANVPDRAESGVGKVYFSHANRATSLSPEILQPLESILISVTKVSNTSSTSKFLCFGALLCSRQGKASANSGAHCANAGRGNSRGSQVGDDIDSG